MTERDVLRQYSQIIWNEVQRERDRDRGRLTDEIDAIIEASGSEPYDWKNSPEGIDAFINRVLSGPAREAAMKRWVEAEQVSEYSREVYDLTMRRR